MKYVEGYTSDNVECCPFCACEDFIHCVQTGEHKCNGCGKIFFVIEGEDER